MARPILESNSLLRTPIFSYKARIFIHHDVFLGFLYCADVSFSRTSLRDKKSCRTNLSGVIEMIYCMSDIKILMVYIMWRLITHFWRITETPEGPEARIETSLGYQQCCFILFFFFSSYFLHTTHPILIISTRIPLQFSRFVTLQKVKCILEFLRF